MTPTILTKPGGDHNPPSGTVARAGTPATPSKETAVAGYVTLGPLTAEIIPATPNPFGTPEKLLADLLAKILEHKTKAGSNSGHRVQILESNLAAMYSLAQKSLHAVKEAHQEYDNLKIRYTEKETSHTETENEHNCKCDQKLEEIKEAINNLTASRTYADAAAGRFKTESELAKKERIEKARLEQRKKEIIISFYDATEDMKERLATITPEALTALVKDHISTTPECANITPHGVRKTSQYTVKIECHQESDALALKQVKWNELEQAKLVVPQYSYIAHGVPKDAVSFQPGTDQGEMIANIERKNGIKVTRIEPLMKKPKNPTAPTHSVVLFSEAWEDADKIIEGCLKLNNGRIVHAERYMPECRLVQCYKCQGFGHKAKWCKGVVKCGKCGEQHETRQHSGEKVQCANCNGPHHAWHHECLNRAGELKRLEQLRATIPSTYGSFTVC
jgi:hypothetical protein